LLQQIGSKIGAIASFWLNVFPGLCTAFSASLSALARNLPTALNFGFDPLVLPSVMEKRLKRFLHVQPNAKRKLSNCCQLLIICREFALPPIMHHEEQIGPVLRCR
jgi:hypothetical protein